MPSVWQKVSQVWQERSVRDRGTVLISVPIASLIAFSGLLLWARGSTKESVAWVNHAQVVRLKSNQLLVEILNAETSVRAYYLVQDEDFLVLYREALRRLPANTAQLKQLVKDNPQQAAKLNEVEQSLLQKQEIFVRNLQAIDAAKVTGRPANLDPLLRQGDAAMQRIRAQIGAFQTAEQQLLALRQERLDQQQTWGTNAVWLCAILGSLSSFVALYLFRTLEADLALHKEDLLEYQDFIQAIANNIVDGVITLDRNGKIKSINPAAAQMFGTTQAEVAGQNISQLLPEASVADNALAQYRLNNSLGTQQGQRIQTMGLRRDGNFFPVDLSISQSSLQAQEDPEWIALIQDITERQQAEAKLKSRADELAQLAAILAKTNANLNAKNQELSQFAYVASHDLKAPLRAISNLSSWIEEDLGDQIPTENQAQFKLLRGRVQRMEALISGLLEYSRVGGTPERPVTVSIAQLLNEVVDSMPLPAEFQVEVAPGMPTFSARRLRLGQVFANLISNAVQHHKRTDGKVAITVQKRDSFYEFSVTDDGPGIEPQYHEKVFTIFQTLEARDKVESTGIGLAIVKKVIEAEGGKIMIQSDGIQGCTFRFTWPQQPTSSDRG
ncbi:MAG: CHASE3 domain-containing protein [Thermosynechococcaceae cyanobacterium MS004]|nr:CHASE3 domain-containing protein [Thermosynechococcaceae cyanobacterium MS004]